MLTPRALTDLPGITIINPSIHVAEVAKALQRFNGPEEICSSIESCDLTYSDLEVAVSNIYISNICIYVYT